MHLKYKWKYLFFRIPLCYAIILLDQFFNVVVGPDEAKFNYFYAGLYRNPIRQMNVVE